MKFFYLVSGSETITLYESINVKINKPIISIKKANFESTKIDVIKKHFKCILNVLYPNIKYEIKVNEGDF